MKTFDEFLADKAEAEGTMSEGDNLEEEEEEEESGSDGEESDSQQDSEERSEVSS